MIQALDEMLDKHPFYFKASEFRNDSPVFSFEEVCRIPTIY
jgi:hypothetical protein